MSKIYFFGLFWYLKGENNLKIFSDCFSVMLENNYLNKRFFLDFKGEFPNSNLCDLWPVWLKWLYELWFGNANNTWSLSYLSMFPILIYCNLYFHFFYFAETQPQLMLTGPIGFNNSTSAPSGGAGAPYTGGAAGNSFPTGGSGMPYQGYSM